MNPKLSDLFKNKKLLEQALTHRSWVNEHPNIRGTNERLEFLGDAILEYVVSREIYQRFPDQEEGFLTALRANLVNTINLSYIASTLDIGKSLYLSKGEEEGGGRTNTSILADSVEAVIGALFIDGGPESAENFISQNIFPQIEEKAKNPLKDAKSTLQEVVQSKGLVAPSYKVIEETGPDHNKNFKIEVMVDGKSLGSGEGKNKSEAAQNAAKDALSKFDV